MVLDKFNLLRMLFAPITRLLGYLSLKAKGILLVVLILIPVSYLSWTQFLILQQQVDLVDRELLGVRYLQQLRPLLEHLPRYRGMSYAIRLGDTNFMAEAHKEREKIHAATEELLVFDQSIASSLGLSGKLDEILDRWHAIEVLNHKQRISAAHCFGLQNDLMKQLLLFIRQVGDNSNLFLDPVADSYHLAAIVLRQVPVLIEAAGQARGIAAAITVKGEVDNESRQALQQLIFSIHHMDDELTLSLAQVSAINPETGRRLQELETVSHKNRDRFITLLEEQFLSDALAKDAVETVFLQGTVAVDSALHLFDQLLPELDQILVLRGKEQRRDLAGSLLVFSLLVLGLLYLSGALYLSINSAVTAIVDVSKQLAADNLSARVRLPGQGELGILRDSINTMGCTLEKDRSNRQVLHHLLQLHLGDTSLEERLEQALELISSMDWINNDLGLGLLMADVKSRTLHLSVQHNLPPEIHDACALVDFGVCHCGRAGDQRNIQYSAAVDERHDIVYENIQPHGHYCVPLCSQEELLGVLMVHLDPGHKKDDAEVQFIESVASTLAELIRASRMNDRLHQAASVFEGTTEAIVITDTDGVILQVNRSFTEITGYVSEEIVGQTPHILLSDHHDQAFYTNFRTVLTETGEWQGELWNRRKNGDVHPTWHNISAVRDSSGTTIKYIGLFSDITEQKMNASRIRYLAHYDVLTDLPNRLLFSERCEHALIRAKREGNTLALLFLDLDRFKAINDSLGHGIGDLVLMEVAILLSNLVRGQDTVARLGGDEFAILLDLLHSPQDASLVACKIITALEAPQQAGEHSLIIGTSIGISIYPDDGDDLETLLKNADAAMYNAKKQGLGRHQYYRSEFTEHAVRRMELEQQLWLAIGSEEFELYYQPQIDLMTGYIAGFEALIRWNHPKEGLVPPGEFLSVCEETGMIITLGKWVLQEACTQAMSWAQAGLKSVRMAVNVSPRQFIAKGFHDHVLAVLSDTGLPPEHLELEITENVMMHDPAEVFQLVQGLKGHGIRLAIDDFGTGYSSLAYLKRFPFDQIKIDRVFIRDLIDDPDDAAIVRATIAMGHNLQVEVLAEGAETKAQVLYLKEQGCDMIQGYFFSRPLPGAEATELLRQGKQYMLKEG